MRSTVLKVTFPNTTSVCTTSTTLVPAENTTSTPQHTHTHTLTRPSSKSATHKHFACLVFFLLCTIWMHLAAAAPPSRARPLAGKHVSTQPPIKHTHTHTSRKYPQSSGMPLMQGQRSNWSNFFFSSLPEKLTSNLTAQRTTISAAAAHPRTQTHTHTFRQVSCEGRLRLLVVGDHLSGQEVHLRDLGGSQSLHPPPEGAAGGGAGGGAADSTGSRTKPHENTSTCV